MGSVANNVRRNTLPNTYIPVLGTSVLTSILARLPRQSIVELCHRWPQMVNSQPQLNGRDLTQRQWNKVVMHESSVFRTDKTPKKKIIDKILLEYWPNGLNLLQLSQIDCQLIVDKPNANSWISSKVKDSLDKEVPIQLNPRKFLEMLTQDLNVIFMSHIYVCRHPRLPLIIIRLQVFDLQTVSHARTSNRPHITSNRPYFVAIPVNSPYVIHTSGSDLVTSILLQVVERNLPQRLNNVLRLETDPKQNPVRSLESMHILHGSSRFGNSLGAWSSYADSTVDISPLAGLETHKTLDKDDSLDTQDPFSADALKKVANLRFKGSTDGVIKSSKLFDQLEPLQRNKRRRKQTVLNQDDETNDTEAPETNQYGSIAPIQNAEFLIQEKYNDNNDNNDNDNYSSITLKLAGTDVFAGLHELSVSVPNEEEMILNPYKMPSWLTGEEGKSCGTVKDGIYMK